MTTAQDPTITSVVIGSARGGPDVPTLRKDRWWLQPLVTVTVLTIFVVYSTWAVFVNKDYFVGNQLINGVRAHRDLISPFYSPCLAASCVPGANHSSVIANWWHITPALIVMGGPLGFRLTCYYYRRTYYRGFWQSPPNCGVADGHRSYTGESRFPLILQNVHRYFFLLALVFNVILSMDAVAAFREPGEGIGFSVGTLVLCVNATLLWLYTLGCHSCRHIVGGRLKHFSRHPVRYRLWGVVSGLNAKHMQFAWASLVFVALTDLYVRLVASGTITDLRLF